MADTLEITLPDVLVSVNSEASTSHVYDPSTAIEIAYSCPTLAAQYAAASDAERITLFQSLPAQDQLDIYLGLNDSERITLYGGLSDAQRLTLLNSLTDLQKDYLIPVYPTYPIPSGQLTEFATYDDRWVELNTLTPARAAVPKYTRRYNLVDFYTLSENNIHGNTLRFTLENGSEPTVGGSGQLIQDHYSGFDFITGTNPDAVSRNFVDELTYVNGLSFAGHDDYFIAPFNALRLFYDPNSSTVFQRYDGSTSKNTSSTIAVSTGALYRCVPNTATLTFAKTTATVGWGIVRIR